MKKQADYYKEKKILPNGYSGEFLWIGKKTCAYSSIWKRGSSGISMTGF